MATKLGKYKRSVSIIGVGCTPFMRTTDPANPELQGYTEGELFGWAAMEAMQDAGIEAKDIDYYYHAQAGVMQSNYGTPAVMVGDWCGLRGKGAAHHSEGCCGGYIAVDVAANMIASGKYDIVLTGGVEMATSIFIPGKPAHMRQHLGPDALWQGVDVLVDRAYSRGMGLTNSQVYMDMVLDKYCREFGLTVEQMDDVMNALAISSRRSASMTDRALYRTPFEDLAKEAGFSDVMEYMRSDYNPKLSRYLRTSGWEATCECAGVVILCATEIAHQFKQQPIEILGMGMSTIETRQPDVEEKATAEALRQVYEMTGLSGADLDLIYANDFAIPSQLLAAELSGYIPRGEGWKYIMDGRTAYDGDKPINTNGGRSCGHAWAASGLCDHYEAVKQMRGQCGARQVKKLPETVLLRGYGGIQNVTAGILRTVQ